MPATTPLRYIVRLLGTVRVVNDRVRTADKY
jgi:hypothetical protein